MKILLTLFVLLFSSSVFAYEGDSYDCRITNVTKSTASGIVESGLENIKFFILEWKSDTIVMDYESIYEIITTEANNVIAKQDLVTDFEPYVFPFQIMYLSDNLFSLSVHSPADNFFVLSMFANCEKK